MRLTSSTQRLPIPRRCSAGSTAMLVRYSGLSHALKYFMSIAQGFFVASLSVAMMRASCLATQTIERRRSSRTRRAVESEDQCPCP